MAPRMHRIVEISTSWFDPNPKWWDFGIDGWYRNATIEYPAHLDHLDDDELCELASNEQDGVRWIIEER